ncbi:MAG: TolC family protein [Gemmatimonadota bacterium]|nr:TolC family protein [Gemmatimonadota bacterium]
MPPRGSPGPQIVALLALLVAARSGHAQSPSALGLQTDTLRLTLAEARSLALEASPELRAARMDTAIARGELKQAGVLFRNNPWVDVLTGTPGTEVGVSQELEVAGQRGARRAAAFAGVERARASVLDTTRITLGEVDRRFFRLAAANERATLALEGLSLNERLAAATRQQLGAGKISKLEDNLATVELGRSRARSLATKRERERFESDLRVVLGLPPRQPIAPIVDSTLTPNPRHVLVDVGVDSLTSLALSRRPDLIALAATARQARALASTARREAFPNLSIRVSSQRTEGTGTRVLRPGVGLSVPIFNRNRGDVEARTAEARKADLQGAALAAEIRLDVARSWDAYLSGNAETDLLQNTVLAPARENRRLLEIAYREGKVGLPVVLLIRNQVIDAELDYWAAWLAEREALTDLVLATGGP